MWMPLENRFVYAFKEAANDSKDEVCNTDLENYSPGRRTFSRGSSSAAPPGGGQRGNTFLAYW